MGTVEEYLGRNQTFAAQNSDGGLPPGLGEAMPAVRAIIIGCADMRVDPAQVLGLTLGEAVVIRNIGGRVTPTVIEELALLGRIGQVLGQTPGGGGEFHLIVLHHTDCGITRLANDPAKLAQYFQINESEGELKGTRFFFWFPRPSPRPEGPFEAQLFRRRLRPAFIAQRAASFQTGLDR